jgi:predicted acetyltransferase
LILVKPSGEYLPAYIAALKRGWSPSASRDDARLEALKRIRTDRRAYLRSLDDPHGRGDAIRLPDGSTVPRIPGFERWMWDGDFAGGISLRWQPGTTDLPPTCLGHVGYGVVPWKRRQGYATEALRMMLPEARKRGLAFVEIVTDLDNIASQRVIAANGGNLIERFRKGVAYGSGEALRFRIDL